MEIWWLHISPLEVFLENPVRHGLSLESQSVVCNNTADSRLALSQWETSLQSNAASHWLAANLESALLNKLLIVIIDIVWNLTHWGRVTHICVGKLTTIGSDNGLSPGRHRAIIWTNAGIMLIGPLGTNFSEILTGIQQFSFKKMYLKMSSAKWRPFGLGLNVLYGWIYIYIYRDRARSCSGLLLLNSTVLLVIENDDPGWHHGLLL